VRLSGGCQCGAVRFRLDGEIRHASVCHCRMCQKAIGAPYGAFASVAIGDLTWTRGQRKLFRSSKGIARGFCGDCGTPLTYEPATGGKSVALTLAAFDEPAAVPPTVQLDRQSRIAWVDGVAQLPEPSEAEQAADAAKYGPVTSFQHPDHDTESWPETPA